MSPTPARTSWIVAAGGLALAALTIAAVAWLELAAGRTAFEAEARTLHRILSQRVDQHDAHMTGLAALVAGRDVPREAVAEVVASIRTFYPRIEAIDVVALTEAPSGPLAAAQRLAPGQAVTVADGGPGRYRLVKRLPDRDGAGRVLAMTVSTEKLLATELDLGPATALGLALPDGTALLDGGGPDAAAGLRAEFRFAEALGSRTQPLVLTVTRRPAWSEILPPGPLLAALGAVGLVAAAVGLGARERRRARDARARARLSEQDARLAHAMRVNMVGEMASGITHELTQPLAAILANSQAGLRLARAARAADPAAADGSAAADEEVAGVLAANVRLARRASDILDRLRAYVTRREPAAELVDLADLARAGLDLTAAELARRGVEVAFSSPAVPAIARVDRISIEQVVQNLLLNAADAMAELPAGARRIEITVAAGPAGASVAVRDHGPGIPPEVLPRLFEPFFTTKSGGMGLGLPLSERLVESHGGRLTAAGHPDGGAVFTAAFPPSPTLSGRLAAE